MTYDISKTNTERQMRNLVLSKKNRNRLAVVESGDIVKSGNIVDSGNVVESNDRFILASVCKTSIYLSSSNHLNIY